MRLFTGLDLPAHVEANITALVDQIKPGTPSIRWSRTANFHVTTKFLGECAAERLEEIIEALHFQAAAVPVFVESLGFFPHARAPRIFWAGIRLTPELLELASITEAALERIGMEKEMRPYSPHLTLARLNPMDNIQNLRQFAMSEKEREFGSFRAEQFHLYESKNSVYTKLRSYSLT